MREKQKQLTGKLGQIEQAAHEKEVPIIPHETVGVPAIFIRTK